MHFVMSKNLETFIEVFQMLPPYFLSPYHQCILQLFTLIIQQMFYSLAFDMLALHF